MTHSDARLAQASDAEATYDAGGGDDGTRNADARTSLPAASQRAGGAVPEFVDDARSLLKTRRLGHAMRAFRDVSSTNTLASEWIEEGAPHGAVVVADYQRRGRGRLGRSWIAAAGLNLTFSVVLRPDLPPERLGMLTIAACVAVAQALDRFAEPLRTSIKWPNDIYLGGRKLCGMLLEASWNAPGQNPAVVLGVGLNANQEEFADELRENATSLLLETGRIIPRAELFAAVLTDLEHSLERLSESEEDVRQEYMRRMMSLGEQIGLRFASNNRRIEGVVRGIDASGGIVLESNSQHLVFHAGEVTRFA